MGPPIYKPHADLPHAEQGPGVSRPYCAEAHTLDPVLRFGWNRGDSGGNPLWRNLGSGGAVDPVGSGGGTNPTLVDSYPGYSFDGGDYLASSASAVISGSIGITVLAWAKPSANITGLETICGRFDLGGATNQRGWALYGNATVDNNELWGAVTDDGLGVGLGGGSYSFSAPACFVPGAWQQVAFKYTLSSKNVDLFRNGIDVTSSSPKSDADLIHPSTADLTVGCMLDNGAPTYHWTGSIGEWMAIPVALTDAQIFAIFQQQRNAYGV